MLDPLQMPILLKAIDFVFDEGRKILQERRERRKTNENTSQDEPEEPQKAEITVLEPEQAKEIKQELQGSKIDEGLWQDHESEVQHLVRLLETYTRNYHVTKEQYAKWGSALVPPIVIHNLTEAENAVMETVGKLESALSKVYNKDIQPNQ